MDVVIDAERVQTYQRVVERHLVDWLLVMRMFVTGSESFPKQVFTTQLDAVFFHERP
jgi:hypothetical protein